MFFRRFLLQLLLSLFVLSPLSAQDTVFARSVIRRLASAEMGGRGYVDRGDARAAAYLAGEYERLGLLSFGKDYFQYYRFPINTFPGKAEMKVNGESLHAGRDFIVASSSRGIRGDFPLVWMADSSLKPEDIRKAVGKMDLRDKFLVLERWPELMKDQDLPGVRGVILLRDGKMVWSVSYGHSTRKMVAIEVMRDKLPAGTLSIGLDIENRFIRKYRTQNVIGYYPGKKVPDSFFVFTAHYDHLGKLGNDTWFPGANDNASGTAMLLDLAAYFREEVNRPDCSVAFMAFSGEEAGLLGSEHYAGHPLFPLSKIRFLINLDMVGTGNDGIGLVNGKEFPAEAAILDSLNTLTGGLKEIRKRGPSAHSDHHPFYEQGVKAVFIYTFGGDHREYHNLNDIPDTMPLTGYPHLFRLITGFTRIYR